MRLGAQDAHVVLRETIGIEMRRDNGGIDTTTCIWTHGAWHGEGSEMETYGIAPEEQSYAISSVCVDRAAVAAIGRGETEIDVDVGECGF